MVWSQLPSILEPHEMDQGISKYVLFILPILSLFSWYFLSLLAKNPQKLNYVNLTENNKEVQYTNAIKLMTLLKGFSSLALVALNEGFLRDMLGMNSSIFISVSIILLILCGIVSILFLFWAATLKD
ncbi:hypothetical protein AZF04_03975 [Alkalihalobacillus trypoxylicola]|uniref:DUF1648 domain-containing protein n=2 Tax=Alkalihalobacillus trypoxylicola TaxID=519424 RepID=A0A162E782_9BACI|nr:hypothetical protein AZF04_03975 [Alkalihalobacillus trypoxylicola]